MLFVTIMDKLAMVCTTDGAVLKISLNTSGKIKYNKLVSDISGVMNMECIGQFLYILTDDELLQIEGKKVRKRVSIKEGSRLLGNVMADGSVYIYNVNGSISRVAVSPSSRKSSGPTVR